MGETVYVVMALPLPTSPPDVGDSLVFGGSLRSASHVAEFCPSPTLSRVRQLVRLMKVTASANGTRLKFVKLRRGSQLYQWAEASDAKLIVPVSFSHGLHAGATA